MNVQEHIQTARHFLSESAREFAAGDVLQASEKLWGAAAHAAVAVAQTREWRHSKHRHLKIAVRRLADELGDARLASGFAAAERFHANFYHGFMDEDEIEQDRVKAREFVEKTLSVLE